MKNKTLLIYTPEKHIPIGESIILPNGEEGVSFRKKIKNGYVTEDMPAIAVIRMLLNL